MVFGLTEMRTATEVEGIFRLSGSEKRIKELKTVFDSPDRYGKGLVWDGYTVHDASNVFRRYLNDLPEPVVPLDLYDQFRQPLRGATKHAGAGDAEGPQFIEGFDEAAAISRYQQLITELPPLNRQLLLYILDLLAVFAAKSEVNRMNSQNLAAIFQPGMLSHPDHAMAPEEYRLNQCVLIFLIENQDHFLIGMQGTAADEKTMQEVEQGTPMIGVTESPVTPTNTGPGSDGLGRTPSNASAAAVSVRRDGMIRRNRSVSSRHSRNDSAGAVPISPAVATTPTSGLARSNTLPSKKSPAIPPGRFQNASSRQPSLSPNSQVPTTRSRGTSPSPTSRAPSAAGASSLGPSTTGAAQRSNEKLIEPQPQSDSALSTPVKNLQTIFQRSPLSDANQRPRNKLKKRAPPGSVNPSAQSSTASLPHSNAVSPRLEPTKPADTPEFQEIAPTPIAENIEEEHPQQMSAAEETPDPTPPGAQVQPTALQLENSLRPKKSPPTSLHSSFNEGSELGQTDELPQSFSSTDQQERERRKRWRLSRGGTKKEEGASPYLPLSPRQATASSLQVESSTSVVSGGGGRPRKSLTNDSSEPASSVMESQATQESIFGAGEKVEGGGRDGGREESKGPIGWIKNKYREAKETHEQRRAKSPPGDGPSGPGSTSRLSFRGLGGDLRGEEERAQVQQVPAQQVAAQQVAAQQTTVQGVQQAASQAQQVPVQGAPQSAPQQETPPQQAPAQSQPASQTQQDPAQSIPQKQVVPEVQTVVPPARESLTPSPAQQGSTIMPVPEEPEPEPEEVPEKVTPQPQVAQEAQAVPAQSEQLPQPQPQTQTQTQPSTVPEEPEKEAQVQMQTQSQPPATVPEEKAV